MSEDLKPKYEKHFYLVTDRKSLDRGHVSVDPIPVSVNGKLEYIGDALLEITDSVIEFRDDGSKKAFATMKALNRRDGIIEITDTLVKRVIMVGAELGYVDMGE